MNDYYWNVFRGEADERTGVNAAVEAVLDDLEVHIRAGIPSGDVWSRRALDKIRDLRGGLKDNE